MPGYDELKGVSPCVGCPGCFLHWRHSWPILKGHLNCSPPKRPGPLLRFLAAPLDGGAARPGGAAPRWRGLARRGRRHALQILRDFSVALVLLPFAYRNKDRSGEDGIAKLQPLFWKSVPWQESWRGSLLGAERSWTRAPSSNQGPESLSKWPLPGVSARSRPCVRLPGVCEMAVRVVAFCFCASR